MKREGREDTDFIEGFIFGRVKDAKNALDRTKKGAGLPFEGVTESTSKNTPKSTPKNIFSTDNDAIKNNPAMAKTASNVTALPRLQKSAKEQTTGRPLLSGHKQQEVLAFLLESKNTAFTYHELKEQLHIPHRGLQRIIATLESLGLLMPLDSLTGRKLIQINENAEALNLLPKGWKNRIREPNTSKSTAISTSENTPEIGLSKIEEIDKNLSILEKYSETLFAEDYPGLHRIGFTVDHLRQVIEKRKRKGASFDTLIRNLWKTDFEASRIFQGQYVLKNSKGETIQDIPGWYVVCLGNPGAYRNPEGWADPELAAAQEEQRLAEQLAKTRQEAERSLLEEWKERLSTQEKQRIEQAYKDQTRQTYMTQSLALDSFFRLKKEEIVALMNNDPLLGINEKILGMDKD